MTCYRTAISAAAALLLAACPAQTQSLGHIVWVPTASTFDGTPFIEVSAGVGLTKLGLPGPVNPAGAGQDVDGVYGFGFATAVPGPDGPTLDQLELEQSPLAAGTRLVLAFDKAADEHVSFVAMLADASQPGNIGVRLLSPTRFEVHATVVDPVASESNNPDALEAAFGLIVQTTQAPEAAFDFRGTVFVTDMVWLDLDALSLAELPQSAEAGDMAGFVVGLAARGVSLTQAAPVAFTAYIPEALFAAGRAHGIDVDGANCLGYRTYVELTGSDDGFDKLNVPTDQPQANAAFDVDGDGNADLVWGFRIRNSQWSRQALMFGRVESDIGVPTASPEPTWGEVKGTQTPR